MGLIGSYGLGDDQSYCMGCGRCSNWESNEYTLIFGGKAGIKFKFCSKCWKSIVKQILAQSGHRDANDFK